MYLVVLSLGSKIHIIDHTDKYECTTICGLSFNRMEHNLRSFDLIPENTCKTCATIHDDIYGPIKDPRARNVSQQRQFFKLHRKEEILVTEEKYNAVIRRFWKKLGRYKYTSNRPIMIKKRKDL